MKPRRGFLNPDDSGEGGAGEASSRGSRARLRRYGGLAPCEERAKVRDTSRTHLAAAGLLGDSFDHIVDLEPVLFEVACDVLERHARALAAGHLPRYGSPDRGDASGLRDLHGRRIPQERLSLNMM